MSRMQRPVARKLHPYDKRNERDGVEWLLESGIWSGAWIVQDPGLRVLYPPVYMH